VVVSGMECVSENTLSCHSEQVSGEMAAEKTDLVLSELEEEKCITQERLHIVVLGASGDLAKKKIYPTLYSLFSHGYLPHHLTIIGYARSPFSSEELRQRLRPFIKVKKEDAETLEAFLKICHYVQGTYDEPHGYQTLDAKITELSHKDIDKCVKRNNRMFYLALPPSVFEPVTTQIKNNVMSKDGWTRVIVEKPFGKDSDSSEQLSQHLKSLFIEDQLYRIDHYLGKEMVQNLITLRFANRIFQHSWSRGVISSVTITQKEPFGTEGRGGYFDEFGIIRDIMQNHLMQIFSLVAMDQPVGLGAEDIRDMKVHVLKATKPVVLDDLVIGQYVASKNPNATGEAKLGYLDDETVPKGSLTPTFAMAVLHIHNARWEGVPFILKCGKALNERKVEVRIQFHSVPGSFFPNAGRDELVLRVQPNEAIYMKMAIKKPGLTFHTTRHKTHTFIEISKTELDLNYNSRYADVPVPEAYERLLLDVLLGAQHNFVRTDELAEAWRIFTPVLKEIESKKIKPIPYEFGSRGPGEADELAVKYGYVHDREYQWRPSL